VKLDLKDKQGALADLWKAAELFQQQGKAELYNEVRDLIRKLEG
jgi:hypothetical protein